MSIPSMWKIIRSPSTHLSLGVLTLGGFMAGVVFWGAFNTGLEATNTEEFCISCHEMEANVQDPPRFIEADTAFHGALARASGNSVYMVLTQVMIASAPSRSKCSIMRLHTSD